MLLALRRRLVGNGEVTNLLWTRGCRSPLGFTRRMCRLRRRARWLWMVSSEVLWNRNWNLLLIILDSCCRRVLVPWMVGGSTLQKVLWNRRWLLRKSGVLVMVKCRFPLIVGMFLFLRYRKLRCRLVVSRIWQRVRKLL